LGDTIRNSDRRFVLCPRISPDLRIFREVLFQVRQRVLLKGAARERLARAALSDVGRRLQRRGGLC